MSSKSAFVISPQEASQLVSSQDTEDNRRCYLLQVIFSPVYGATISPPSYKKLPRLINGIPLGPGKLTQSQADATVWRYIEGCGDVHMFLSQPITQEEANGTRVTFSNLLVRQAKAIFGDVTVKTTLLLSQCLAFDSGIFLNDVASAVDDGLYLSFTD